MAAMGTAAAWAEAVSGSAGVAKEVTRGKRAALQVEEVGEVRGGGDGGGNAGGAVTETEEAVMGRWRGWWCSGWR